MKSSELADPNERKKGEATCSRKRTCRRSDIPVPIEVLQACSGSESTVVGDANFFDASRMAARWGRGGDDHQMLARLLEGSNHNREWLIEEAVRHVRCGGGRGE